MRSYRANRCEIVINPCYGDDKKRDEEKTVKKRRTIKIDR